MQVYVAMDTSQGKYISWDGSLVSVSSLDLVPAFCKEEDAELFGISVGAEGVTAVKIDRVSSVATSKSDWTEALGIPKYDYLGLVRFFEENRRDKKGKKIAGYTDVGRQRKALELKNASENCWSFAVDAVLFALDNHYQGFSDGNQLYYKADLDIAKAKEALENR